MLVGITGTIGIYDYLYFVEAFRGTVARDLRVIQTPTAARMLDPRIVSTILRCEVWTDQWDDREGVKVPHAELPAWADMFVVLPATANLLSAVARGDAGGLLPLSVLASGRPVGFVPHMNPTMWRAPATRRNAAQLREDGHLVFDPETGGAEGRAMSDPDAPAFPSPSPADIKGFLVELATASGIDVSSAQADAIELPDVQAHRAGVRDALASER
jgi:phosphopantothenoylcysteine decarboxylase/phosphopantothenate--cysteine ligase